MIMLSLTSVIPDPASLPTHTWLLVFTLFWSARLPMAVLSVPLVLLERVRVPSATLLSPMVLAASAAQPMAVLAPPVVLFVSAEKPVAVLELPLLLKTRAATPTAVFCVPLVLSNNAAAPTAVLESALFSTSAPTPTPVLKLPVLSVKSARQPSPVFPVPVVRELSASQPSAVVRLGKHPSGGGVTARAADKSKKQPNTNRMGCNVVLGFFIFLVRFISQLSVSSRSRNSFRFVYNDLRRWLLHFESDIHFVDLLDLLFNSGGKHLYLVLLLQDGCLEVLKFEVKHGLPGTIGNGLGLDPFFGRGFSGISAGRSRGRGRTRTRSSADCA